MNDVLGRRKIVAMNHDDECETALERYIKRGQFLEMPTTTESDQKRSRYKYDGASSHDPLNDKCLKEKVSDTMRQYGHDPEKSHNHHTMSNNDLIKSAQVYLDVNQATSSFYADDDGDESRGWKTVSLKDEDYGDGFVYGVHFPTKLQKSKNNPERLYSQPMRANFKGMKPHIPDEFTHAKHDAILHGLQGNTHLKKSKKDRDVTIRIQEPVSDEKVNYNIEVRHRALQNMEVKVDEPISSDTMIPNKMLHRGNMMIVPAPKASTFMDFPLHHILSRRSMDPNTISSMITDPLIRHGNNHEEHDESSAFRGEAMMMDENGNPTPTTNSSTSAQQQNYWANQKRNVAKIEKLNSNPIEQQREWMREGAGNSVSRGPMDMKLPVSQKDDRIYVRSFLGPLLSQFASWSSPGKFQQLTDNKHGHKNRGDHYMQDQHRPQPSFSASVKGPINSSPNTYPKDIRKTTRQPYDARLQQEYVSFEPFLGGSIREQMPFLQNRLVERPVTYSGRGDGSNDMYGPEMGVRYGFMQGATELQPQNFSDHTHGMNDRTTNNQSMIANRMTSIPSFMASNGGGELQYAPLPSMTGKMREDSNMAFQTTMYSQGEMPSGMVMPGRQSNLPIHQSMLSEQLNHGYGMSKSFAFNQMETNPTLMHDMEAQENTKYYDNTVDGFYKHAGQTPSKMLIPGQSHYETNQDHNHWDSTYAPNFDNPGSYGVQSPYTTNVRRRDVFVKKDMEGAHHYVPGRESNQHLPRYHSGMDWRRDRRIDDPITNDEIQTYVSRRGPPMTSQSKNYSPANNADPYLGMTNQWEAPQMTNEMSNASSFNQVVNAEQQWWASANAPTQPEVPFYQFRPLLA